MMNAPFKICTFCAKRWETRIDLILDKNLVINGYQASFDDALEGLFLFTHNVKGCGTTLAVLESELKFIYDGPEYTTQREEFNLCEGHCSHPDSLEPCPLECCMKWIRDVIQILKNPKSEELIKKLNKADHGTLQAQKDPKPPRAQPPTT